MLTKRFSKVKHSNPTCFLWYVWHGCRSLICWRFILEILNFADMFWDYLSGYNNSQSLHWSCSAHHRVIQIQIKIPLVLHPNQLKIIRTTAAAERMKCLSPAYVSFSFSFRRKICIYWLIMEQSLNCHFELKNKWPESKLKNSLAFFICLPQLNSSLNLKEGNISLTFQHN